jgi:hypothetical protein
MHAMTTWYVNLGRRFLNLDYVERRRTAERGDEAETEKRVMVKVEQFGSHYGRSTDKNFGALTSRAKGPVSRQSWQ